MLANQCPARWCRSSGGHGGDAAQHCQLDAGAGRRAEQAEQAEQAVCHIRSGWTPWGADCAAVVGAGHLVVEVIRGPSRSREPVASRKAVLSQPTHRDSADYPMNCLGGDWLMQFAEHLVRTEGPFLDSSLPRVRLTAFCCSAHVARHDACRRCCRRR